MPLSPVDFYAYSQATGAPVADTPEKRAQQAPQVLAFRQQQLQAPKQGGGLLDTLGKVAAVAGLAAGGYGIARALRNRGVQEAVQQAHVQDLGTQAEQNVRRAAAYQSPPPSNVATTAPASATGTTASPTPVTQRPSAGVEIASLTPKALPAAAERPNAYEMLGHYMSQGGTDAWHADSAAHAIANEASLTQNQPPKALPPSQRPSGYDALKNYTYITGRIAPADTLVDQQHAILPNTINQSINAVTSSEDQVTGRMKHLLQQNPHMDMSQIELMEEMAEHSHIQGMDQPEPMHQVATEALGHPVVSQQEMTGPQAAQQFFQQQREELAAQGIRGLRAERAMAEPLMKGAPYVEGQEGFQQRQQKKGLALALQTGDPNILKVFATGELPETVKLQAGASQLGEVPTSVFMGPTTMPEAIEGVRAKHEEHVGGLKTKLESIINEVQPQINSLENQQYQEYLHAQERIPQIDQQLMMIEHSLARGRTSGSGELLGYRGALTAERNKLSQFTGDHYQDQIDNLKYRLDRAHEVYGGLIEGAQPSIPQTLKTWSDELLKVTPSQTTTTQAGYIDPATGEFKTSKQVELGSTQPITTIEGLELGPVSQARETKAKGGGGRNVAEFVAGKREPEVVRAVKGVGFLRDYDPETGAVAQHYQSDETQPKQIYIDKRFDPQTGTYLPVYQTEAGLNRAVDIYGVRRATDVPSDPTMRPTQFVGTEATSGATKLPHSISLASVNISEAARKGEIQLPRQQTVQQSSINPQKYFEIPSLFVKLQPTMTETRQLNLPSDVVPSTSVAAKTRLTPADLAAQQLESYMSKLQRGRSTPLTSEVVIQPRLF